MAIGQINVIITVKPLIEALDFCQCRTSINGAGYFDYRYRIVSETRRLPVCKTRLLSEFFTV